MMIADSETWVTPTQDQITRTKNKINASVQSIKSNPNYRADSAPFYGFHNAGEAVRGTVIIFHGFSAKPTQLSALSDYLYNNGFNYYQANLANHTLQPPNKFWCQVDLKPEILNPLREKAQKDPVLQNFLASLPEDPSKYERPPMLQMANLVARLMLIEPRLMGIMAAAENDNDPNFSRYFISNHMDYLTDARKRLDELDAMPGPIYIIGLSVGGAIALGLAADQPKRIAKVVAYTPLLKLYEPTVERYIELAGPLDMYEKSWHPGESFPVGALTAASRYGAYVREPKNIKALQNVPTWMVLTENEDAASIPTNEDFFGKIGGTDAGHRLFKYPAADLVPHPLAEPNVKSQGMTNRFWQSLYQETFRFLTTGEYDPSNMDTVEQDPNLPQVAPV